MMQFRGGQTDNTADLIIDPQKEVHKDGSLAAPNADADSERVADIIMEIFESHGFSSPSPSHRALTSEDAEPLVYQLMRNGDLI
jgi:hypothetical protein